MVNIGTLLIANRGEIACRIIATCRCLGINTVAIYAEIDRHAKHVELADVAYQVSGDTPVSAYLNIAAIIAIAKQSGADAIHPGYGFLSENTDFSAACDAAGIIFVGPPASAIAAMGSKSAAKNIMQKAGVPLIPGYHGSEQTLTALSKAAANIGYPLLIKAALGGGGKGMRVVNHAEEFAAQLNAAKREAKASFADEQMLLEKYFTGPRHIEVQIFADQHGNCIYLGDRDCSLQRRHQKVIEEAPAPGLSDATRRAMGQAAVAAARAINYVGAGTIEFLMDAAQQFYFMEMNTRLQVEHPITEMITGVDLVEWQLRVASGASLPLSQAEVQLTGHAIEARIYAEDPQQQFLPASGVLQRLTFPATSAQLRIDSGVRTGAQLEEQISAYYDPMIAKMIVHQPSRKLALAQLKRALEHSAIVGVKHNLAFLAALASHSEFVATHFTTHFIGEHLEALLQQPNELWRHCAAAMAVILSQPNANSPLTAFRLNGAASWHIYLEPVTAQPQGFWLQVQRTEAGYLLSIDRQQHQFNAHLFAPEQLQLSVNGRSEQLQFMRHGERLTLLYQGHSFDYQLVPTHQPQQSASTHSFCAPMNGTIVTQLVPPNQPVKQGQGLIVMEAMKMEYQINAPSAGVVSEFCFAAGDLVQEGAQLLHFVADDTADTANTGGG
ncbi:ATP-grasp domain-containing protein [Shewanella sp. C32]|uniref:ATP-grasp domain-containing protein n=1 Tax=Shewanella electrica TaxID=515560 RepID=A0ABT2FK67_9GAMM|nr:biotin carboxylase N-terminal domain-containing protein [Shewanella electrica]MCH1924500.1 ATP-grasp domain-containing protein [Shewanella electrica]MCS4556401.1 ATP-grasp domain-containing protein [Shewanella electrica]